jgi:hypothetical protein
MILGFSTQLNGKATYFVEKILAGLIDKMVSSDDKPFGINLKKHINDYADFKKVKRVDSFKLIEYAEPKLHTIREDQTNRWKSGMKIDFFINVRTKNMFRFAPVLTVVSVQKIEIKWFIEGKRKSVRIIIDGKEFAYIKFLYGVNTTSFQVTGKASLISENDGFDFLQDFFTYFDKDFTGKIIHWTDLKY